MQRNRITPFRFLLLPLVLLAGIQGAHAQRAGNDPGRGWWKDRLVAHIKYLAGEELEGRRTASGGNKTAAEYIIREFKNYGLVPLAADGFSGYTHSFSYPVGLKVGKGNELTIVREKEKPVRLEPGRDFNPMGFSEAGEVKGDLVFVGYGIVSEEMKYDDYAGVNTDGKIVLVMRGSPDPDNPHSHFGAQESYARKVIVAREHGAAGIIFIDPPSQDKRSLQEPALDRNFLHSGIVAAIARDTVFAALRDSQGRSIAELQERIDATRQPASFAPPGYGVILKTDVELSREMVPNVVGVLPGNDPKLRDEYVVIGAHFDHLGHGGEGSLYGGTMLKIHYGADDNASGTAGMMLLAEHYAKSRSNGRSIIFMAFNGEEEGLLGSSAIVAEKGFPADRVAAMINMDMIGRLDSNTLVVYGIGTSPSWKGLIDSLNAGDRFTLKQISDGYGPSDHTSFYRKDIPVLFFFTGLHPDYHRPSDTWDKINYDGMVQVLGMVQESADWIASRSGRLQFTKTETNATRANTGFRVYVGTIPDYAFEGKGLRLSGVSEGGPAAKAGLQEGDIIVKMGPKEINNIYDYTYALGEFRPKEKVEVEFLRGEETMKATVELASR